MSAPSKYEKAYYKKLVGRQIVAVVWQDIDGLPLPVLLLSGQDKDGNAPTVAVLADPEGNGPGHLEHNL